jgi:hypothetical protein
MSDAARRVVDDLFDPSSRRVYGLNAPVDLSSSVSVWS